MKAQADPSGPEATDQDYTKENLLTKRLCLKIAEAAKVLGVNPATIRRMIKRGLLRPYRGLRTPLIPLAQLRRLIEDQVEPDPALGDHVPKGGQAKPSKSAKVKIQAGSTNVNEKGEACER